MGLCQVMLQFGSLPICLTALNISIAVRRSWSNPGDPSSCKLSSLSSSLIRACKSAHSCRIPSPTGGGLYSTSPPGMRRRERKIVSAFFFGLSPPPFWPCWLDKEWQLSECAGFQIDTKWIRPLVITAYEHLSLPQTITWGAGV